MIRLTIILLGYALLSGCSSVPRQETADILPAAAVDMAAERPLTGTFRMAVRGSGRRDERLYLNSEANYRDPKCLTISMPESVAGKLAQAVGGDPAVVLHGRTIRVHGVASKIRIGFVDKDGEYTGRFYYQIHVDVTKAAQIEVL